jgi:hypothetical protein
MKSSHLNSSLFRLLLLATLVVGWSPVAAGQGTTKAKTAAAQKAQAFSPGIKIGQKMPAVSLKNQKGETVSVQSMLQTGPVALVVYRSADW